MPPLNIIINIIISIILDIYEVLLDVETLLGTINLSFSYRVDPISTPLMLRHSSDHVFARP